MDLTKLRDAWRKRAAELRSRASIVISAAYRTLEAEAQGYTNCADELDSALAAVPQDTVEAVREAVAPYCTAEGDWDRDDVRAAIRQALAARPVRAVLTEEQVDRAMEEAMEPSGIACQECGDDGIILNPKLFTAALNAALERQHAEPPEYAAVEEAKARLANWTNQGIRYLAGRAWKQLQADIRLVCGAKP